MVPLARVANQSWSGEEVSKARVSSQNAGLFYKPCLYKPTEIIYIFLLAIKLLLEKVLLVNVANHETAVFCILIRVVDALN